MRVRTAAARRPSFRRGQTPVKRPQVRLGPQRPEAGAARGRGVLCGRRQQHQVHSGPGGGARRGLGVACRRQSSWGIGARERAQLKPPPQPPQPPNPRPPRLGGPTAPSSNTPNPRPPGSLPAAEAQRGQLRRVPHVSPRAGGAGAAPRPPRLALALLAPLSAASGRRLFGLQGVSKPGGGVAGGSRGRAPAGLCRRLCPRLLLGSTAAPARAQPAPTPAPAAPRPRRRPK